MIFLTQKDKDEIEIHIKSVYGVSVTLKNHLRNTTVYNNIINIHWMKDDYKIVLTKINGMEIVLDSALFFWLSFEPSTKLES